MWCRHLKPDIQIRKGAFIFYIYFIKDKYIDT